MIPLLDLYSQGGGGYQRKSKDAFPQQPRFEPSHWYFGPGVTVTTAPFSTRKAEGLSTGDTLYTSQLKHGVKIGLYAEFGRYRMINNLYFFRYWNYGLNYRWISGNEQYTDQLGVGEQTTNIGSGENTFSDHFLDAHVEINGANKLSDVSFLQHSLGLRAGYAMISKRTYNDHLVGLSPTTQDRFHSYLFYRFGWGFKANKKLIVIPSVEVPIFNVFTFSKGRPDVPYFNSQYWPITLCVRFFLFRPFKLENCPPVESIGLPEGFDPDEPKNN